MTAEPRPKLIFLVTEDWFFWSHRLPMARAAQAAGFDVAVATRVDKHGERIRAAGFTLHSLRWRRRELGPWATLASIIEITRLYRRERPLIAHHVALKAVVIGSIAALLARVPAVVSVIPGMGYVTGGRGLRARLLNRVARLSLRWLLSWRNARIMVENEDDEALLAALRPGAGDRVVVVPGSGLELERFNPVPEPPAPPVIAAFVGRMVALKGVPTLVEAQQRLQRRGIDLRLVLAGAPDPENPTSIDPRTLARWQSLPGIQWLGHQEDVPGIWAASHIAVLPSRSEGLPMSLVEAAAMARPIVATDIPGCRQIALAGVNALLVPPDDPDALAEALATLAADAGLRRRFGAAGRQRVEQRFSERRVREVTQEVYRDLLAGLREGEAGAAKTS